MFAAHRETVQASKPPGSRLSRLDPECCARAHIGGRRDLSGWRAAVERNPAFRPNTSVRSALLPSLVATPSGRGDSRAIARRPDVGLPIAAALGLAVVIGVSVMSDAEAKVPTGGELTLFEAVGRWA
jgi:hypothetical protein